LNRERLKVGARRPGAVHAGGRRAGRRGWCFEIERTNSRWPLGGPADWTDGAAPLIRSSLEIRTVRARLEKVTATDFTVLIEGGSGPQPHPGFIEIFREVALHDGDGAAARAEMEAERMRLRRRFPIQASALG
jgi:hypothetical protein